MTETCLFRKKQITESCKSLGACIGPKRGPVCYANRQEKSPYPLSNRLIVVFLSKPGNQRELSHYDQDFLDATLKDSMAGMEAKKVAFMENIVPQWLPMAKENDKLLDY